MRAWAFAMLTALAPVTAQAASQDGNFALEGVGAAPCSAFIQAAEDKSNMFWNMGGWIDGFLTGYNAYVDDTFDVTSFAPNQSTDLIANFLRRHCQENPDHRLGMVMKSLVERLHDIRLSRGSEVVDVEVGGETYPVYEEVLRRAQERLRAKGHYDGAIDGKFGPNTRAALTAFQKAGGLPETGAPDQPTLLQLLLN